MRDATGTDVYYATTVYKQLEVQLEMMSKYSRCINRSDTARHSYINILIGVTELQMALAQAIVQSAMSTANS